MGYIFGKIIHEMRKAKGLTLEEVAKQIDSCKGYISGIETSKRRPPSDQIIRKLAKILAINKKALIRLAHVDKIPEDIKQELQISTIITPKKIIDTMGSDLASLLKSGEERKKKSQAPYPAGYVPVLNSTDESAFPCSFENFQLLLENCSEFVQFSLPGTPVAFALRMPDISMTRKRGNSFPQGSLIFFSPIKRLRVEDSIFLVYRTENGLKSIFRCLKEYNRRKVHLVPFNSRYRKEIILPRRMIESFWKAVARLEIFE